MNGIQCKLVAMEGILQTHLFNNGLLRLRCKEAVKCNFFGNLITQTTLPSEYFSSSVHHKLPELASDSRGTVKVCARRRMRANERSETYVLLEPGEEEKFVSEEELKATLKGWLENWPGKELPPDLARYETVDDAVSFLVRSVCELQIDGDVGSVQWYEVRLD
ncbi:hypothetical protein L6164_006714 [Bauhinia variegata]|uniref:Uncharacterized protein n=1 Tax=Bauhinia variegata TaxID=167791 RepID=A0ACB9PWS5_BAUVA|nr:hypothetical protein L6164_006714 [Bauhinia variegata]